MANALQSIAAFLRSEAGRGVVLMAAMAAALVVANSALEPLYLSLLDLPAAVRLGTIVIDKPLLLWINDGLMAIFFLMVGLEIKREVREGGLANFRQAVLPCLGAVGGMVAPALVYVAFVAGDSASLRGWAIPCATDIAFALGLLALAGPRISPALRVFLLALAIIDDLGAIAIIGLIYTEDLSYSALELAGVFAAALLVFNLVGVRRLVPYLLVGLFLWVCVLKSGVHATLAGVAVAMLIPIRPASREGGGESPLEHLEHMLLPWVGFAIMPSFAFANAGVAFAGLSREDLTAPLSLGIALGLFLGKQLGIFVVGWLVVKIGLCRPPEGLSWPAFYGVSLLAGIGFTMSLFIGSLAYDDLAHATAIRLGVFSGSLLSAVLGYFWLRAVGSARPRKTA